MKRHDCTEWEAFIEAMVDGELTASDRNQLERELTQCEQCRARLDALTEMRELVRVRIEDAVGQVDFAPLWSGIQAGLEQEETASNPLQLQAFADGELSSHEMLSVADELMRSPGAHRQLEAIAEMGDLIRASINHAVQSVDFEPLWRRLDEAVGKEIEARGGFRVALASRQAPPRMGWFDRVLAAIGGYRSILMSAATAAIVALILVPILNRGEVSEPGEPGVNSSMTQTVGSFDNRPQQLEIRVVHVNEVVSNPGHQVTVDSYDGYAPVIYIRPEEDRRDQPDDVTVPGTTVFQDPI